MQWQELKRKQEAPESGWILAYTRKKVIFHRYQSVEELDVELADKCLLELHLFDQDKEYRSLSTRSMRFPDGFIETLEDFEEQEVKEKLGIQAKCVYAERVLISDQWKEQEITVLNHIKYQEESGMAVVDNYRLKI